MIIERLFRGSIINYRNFFVSGDKSEVKITFAEPSVLNEMTYESLTKIMKKHPNFEK
jgi:hypothetical protein